MGAESSKGSKSRELPKLEAPPGGLSVITPQNAKLTGTEPTTFRMPPSWWTGALQTVRDVYSDEVLFGTQSRPPAAGGIKAVFNPNGTMAFGLRQVHASLTLPPHILVSPTGQEVCKVGLATAVVGFS